MNQINIILFNAINHFAKQNIILDTIGILIAQYTVFIFILFLLYIWFKKNDKKIALYAGYSSIIGILFNLIISITYFHPRPFMEEVGNQLINHSAQTSFPSDHTTFMLSISFMLIYFKKTRKAGIILSIIGLISGIARIYCGIHYPFDIIGSIIVSIIASRAIFISKEKLQPINKAIINTYKKIITH